ncbi:MAG: hypothetical protein LQ350_008129 [Teloschistes chrysophthalmus]|nr:MAG: hypothetical protein LQ350_008129 [Niorma chrysophthalma]
MAPQTSIPVSANILGTIGTVFWCIQLIPQIWYNWRKKKTDGLPGLMMFLWAICAVPLGVYVIVQNFNLPIQIQPQIFCVLALTSWAQILIYNNGWAVWKATTLAIGTGILFGSTQVLLILTLRGPYERGIEWPMTLVGVISAVLLASGLIPPYFEIAKRHGRVVGINFVFLGMDWLGAFFSLMALVAQQTFDYLGGVQYLVCLLLELGIFTSHALFLLRSRRLRAHAKATNTAFDELPEASRYVYPRPCPEDITEFPRPDTSATTETAVANEGVVERVTTADSEKAVLEQAKKEAVKEKRKSAGGISEKRLSAGAGRWPVRDRDSPSSTTSAV